ncbi:prepilin-type N-terminal cleavage/methylation domain-containing protein [Hydrogenophilus thermoluteolus]|uniref:prepilin-type N-terminal cleavage/methylation domain-containing protein n=1 Tax=Hydrogenophilus thermoluteolus TaxID=297 RepID=UPI0024A27713|nr:prepilin-type N-terminal cleavage/methylation domain-containing protein [Hydrogenophilus thermoluteolus]GLW60999.1 prepilin-type N-terminal cleavage/methylation domain-containing protein [Hydrogenophilus thermoluteolus]
MTFKRAQSGFTLVEIAIVLVIIGLLLGGVLKGQELIENAKVKNAINDINAIKTAYYSYQDRYKRLPGDDGNLAALQARGGTWANVTQGGDNNGVIAVTAAQTFNGGGENDNFFQHLRAAGFLTGDATVAGAAALPRNSFGGLIGITNAAVLGYNQATLMVCLGNVPGKAAAAIDSQIDDGVANTGSVRATQGANNTAPGAAATAYSEDQSYTVCSTL